MAPLLAMFVHRCVILYNFFFLAPGVATSVVFQLAGRLTCAANDVGLSTLSDDIGNVAETEAITTSTIQRSKSASSTSLTQQIAYPPCPDRLHGAQTM